MRKPSILLAGLAIVLLAWTASGQLQAPACQARALRTVSEGRSKAILGEKDQARKLLEQADRECGTSKAVLAGIAEVYEQIGDPVLASIYRKNALNSGSAGVGEASTSAEKDRGLVREKFALVVGIGNFKDPAIPRLKYAAKDARDFAATLADPATGRFFPENVTVLTDQQATYQAIRSALARIASKAMKDDMVLLYFSTHGSSPVSDRSKIGAGYLVTYDTDVKEVSATAYGMHHLANFIKQELRADRIVAFLDTCYSGDTTRVISGAKALEVEDYSGLVPQGKGTVVITSSSGRELSWESDDKQNSFFTMYLIDSLKSRQGLGNVRQLYTDIQRQIPAAVRDYTRRKGLGDQGRGATQNPAIYPISDIPDIIIGAPTK